MVKYLDKTPDEGPIYVIEAFVGMLRHEFKATSKNVKNYLTSMEGLNLRLNNMDYYNYSLEWAEKHQEALKGPTCEMFFKGDDQTKKEYLPFAPVFQLVIKMLNLIVQCTTEKET